MEIKATNLIYMQSRNLIDTAVIVKIEKIEDKIVIILDKTIFYPQGGGQPCDIGIIKSNKTIFEITDVRFEDGLVKHFGMILTDNSLVVGDVVTCEVNQERRQLNSRLHSAGHIIEMAQKQLNMNLTPSKRYHFPDSPYVEYIYESTDINLDSMLSNLVKVCKEIISENLEVTYIMTDSDNLKKYTHYIPSNLPVNKPIRVVMFGQNFGLPCGGTHVENISQIVSMNIKKITHKKNLLKISYDVIR